MANVDKGWGHYAVGTRAIVADTTANFDLGQAANSNVAGFVFQIQKTGWTGSVKAQVRAPGAEHADLNVDWDTVGLVNLDTFAEVAGSTGATDDGAFRFNADHGMLARLAVTVSAGSLKILVRKGDG